MPFREQELPPEADRSVLVVGLNGLVFGLDRDTGIMKWENKLPRGGYGPVYVAMRYGAVVASANGSRLFRLDYRTGEAMWVANTSASGRATILIEQDRIIVAKGGYLDCFDHAGTAMWKQPLSGKGMGRVALGFPSNVA